MEESVSPIPCNLDQVDEEALTKCRRGLVKATSHDSLQFLVPLQHDPTDDTAVDEAYSFPLSMRRPRSDSGSRYLTDDVIYCRLLFSSGADPFLPPGWAACYICPSMRLYQF